MLLLQIAVTCATVVAICAGIPQLRKLIRMKSSDEFNLGTWGMWVLTQVIFVSYAVAIKDPLLIGVNTAWIAFYGAMVVLIIYYRPRKLAPVSAQNEAPTPKSR